MKRTTLLAASLLALAAHAQDYRRHVDVEVELDPKLRAASRLDQSPVTLQATAPTMSLRYNGRAVAAPVTPLLADLPVACPDSIYRESPYRGYFAAGYFPLADGGLTAGYRLVATPTHRLDAFTQFSYNNYKAAAPGAIDNVKFNSTDWIAQLDYSLSTRPGVLDVSLGGNLASFNMPRAALPARQGVGRGTAHMTWTSSHHSRFNYSIEAHGELLRLARTPVPGGFSFFNADVDFPRRELALDVTARAEVTLTRGWLLGLTAGYAGTSLDRDYVLSFNSNGTVVEGTGRSNKTLMSVGGSINGRVEDFLLMAGTTVNIAAPQTPHVLMDFDARAAWVPSPYLAMSGFINTASHLNTIYEVMALDRYLTPLQAPGVSRSADIGVDLVIGPLAGVTVSGVVAVSGGTDALVPCIINGLPTYGWQDITTGRYGVKVKWDWSSRLALKAGIEGAHTGGIDTGYYRWLDRASRVIDGGVEFKPVKRLTMAVAYELRTGRKSYSEVYREVPSEDGDPDKTTYVSDGGLLDLGDISSLSLSADWQLNDRLTIFGRVSGLTQPRWLLPSGVPGRRVAGLAGVTLRF